MGVRFSQEAPLKLCENCDSSIEGHGKRFCSLSCGTKWQQAAKAHPIGYCQLCGKVFSRRKDGRKVFCSSTCSASRTRTKRIDPLSRLCGCGARKSASAAHCRACHFSERNRLAVEKWLTGGWDGSDKFGLSKTIRDFLLKKENYECSKYKWSGVNPTSGKTTLQVDHIDGDAYNNRPENLQVLCPNCHSLTPNYGSLNKSGTRAYRYRSESVVD